MEHSSLRAAGPPLSVPGIHPAGPQNHQRPLLFSSASKTGGTPRIDLQAVPWQFRRQVDAVAPAFLKWGLKGAGLTGAIGVRLMNAGIRANIEEMARQFIDGENGREAAKRMGKLRQDGYAVVADLLGEATVTPEEEEAFEQACLDLVSGMDAARTRWAPLGGGTGALDWGSSPMVQLSIKPSALCCTARPEDPEHSAAAIENRLARIYRRVIEADGAWCIDMESRKYKAITLDAFRRLRARPEFRAHDRLGIVLHSYLRESENDLESLLESA